MILIHSGNADLATKHVETVRPERSSATNPSTKKTSPRNKSSKGQDTSKADESPVAFGKAPASMKPHAKTTTGGSSAGITLKNVSKSEPTKTEFVLNKLRLARGVTISQIVEVTGWQTHSVRGFLSGVVRRKLGLELVSEVGKDGLRRYRIVEGEGLQAQEKPKARKSGRHIADSDSTIADRGDAGADSSADSDSCTEFGNEAAPDSLVVATRKA